MKGLVVIPAFNEEKVIESVITRIPNIIDGFAIDTVVINDGSTDMTSAIVRKLGIKLLEHPINRGLGAALATGFEYARIKKYDFLITLDGDGQHDPSELNRLLKPIFNQKVDFVVGTRFGKKGMPKIRTVLTFLASLATYLFTGVWTSDSQSGYRAFSKKAIENIYLETDRMEVSSEFFEKAKLKNLKVKEIPIKAIYTKYSLEKGQRLSNSFNILSKLFMKKLIE